MSTTTVTTAAFGPRNRESFFAAQARNRRATWRMSAFCFVAALVMGIPLSLTITPLIYAVALGIASAINYFHPLPPEFWIWAEHIGRTGINFIIQIGSHKSAAGWSGLVPGAVIMLAPGIALSLMLWLGVLALFHRAGVGGALLALNAREPNPARLDELKLSDVVQEMAIAAGLPAPKIMFVDAPGANAAAIGTSPNDARLVVTRGLLEVLNREELEATLAHLVGAIGNGDLSVAFRVTSLFESCGLLLMLLNSPFGLRSRGVLWRIVRYGLGGPRSKGDPAEAQAVADVLVGCAGLETDDIDRMFDPTRKKSIFRSARDFLLFPIFFTNFAIKLSLWFFSGVLVGPAVGLLWRTRVYLADASAVQLVRNPDDLASALQKLAATDTTVPGGDWAAHLFVVKPAVGSEGRRPSQVEMKAVAQAWATASSVSSDAANASSGVLQQSTAAPVTAGVAASTMPFAASPIAATAPQFSVATPANFAIDPARFRQEIFGVYQSAMRGDAPSIAKLSAFQQALATAEGAPKMEMPNIADLATARRGDAAAIARLRTFHAQHVAPHAPPDAKSAAPKPNDVSSLSFVPFHPGVKRRLRRLNRMGAHADASSDPGMIKVAIVIGLFLAPFAIMLVALMLLLIAILTLASVGFLVVWLAVIHAIFTAVVGH
jgi:Zn-dependent protease with chaperone function